jgi:hypothetical protein
MLMGPGYSDIALAIHSIVGTKSRQAFQNAIPDRSIAHGRIDNQVYNAVVVIVRVSDDEGSRVDSLTETSADLTKACIALKAWSALSEEAHHKLYFDNWSTKFKLTMCTATGCGET